MDIQAALQELADRIKQEILHRMESNIGVNPRTGTNTLVDSDLYDSVDVSVHGDDTLVFSILQHWEFVSLGWMHTGRFPNTMDKFIENIIDWIRRKHIHSYDKTENQLAWAIVKNILRHGIMARPFIIYDTEERPDVILPFLDAFMNRFMDDIFQEICGEIDTRFN